MSPFSLLVLCVQACLIQCVYSQYFARGGIVAPNIGPLAYDATWGSFGLGLPYGGYGAYGGYGSFGGCNFGVSDMAVVDTVDGGVVVDAVEVVDPMVPLTCSKLMIFNIA